MRDTPDLVVVRAYSHPHEAHLACSAVRAAGVTATIADSHIVAANWLYSNYVGGVKVLVREEDLAIAREVLETPATVDKDDERRNNRGAAAAPLCPRCGSDRIISVRRGGRLAVLTWLMTDVPLFPVSRKVRCQNCGFEGSRSRLAA